jgi:hypothetical protein
MVVAFEASTAFRLSTKLCKSAVKPVTVNVVPGSWKNRRDWRSIFGGDADQR